MDTIKIPNYSALNLLEPTTLDADAAVDSQSFTVVNSMNYAQNDKFLLGNKGSDTGEIFTVSSVSGQVISTTEKSKIVHTRFEPINKLFGDQVCLYRAANVDGTIPSDTSFTKLSTTNMNIDELYTDVEDASGGSAYWYKFTYYNSVSGDESNLSASLATRGGDYGHLVTLQEIRQEAGFADAPYIDDSDIATARDRAESQVKGACAAAGYTMPLQTENAVYYTPAIILDCALLLAAGMVMSQQYQTTAPEAAKLGDSKRREAERTLKQIGKHEIILLDETEKPLACEYRVSGWPDETTADVGVDGVNGEPSKFTMSQKF